ncbi:MAG: S1/P1 nuclease [Alphaproteobacteria bacterium]|nr:S1/P1 nuclease [Alphaproteobacteria bacterium]
MSATVAGMTRPLASCCLLLLLLAFPAQAWGPMGHRLVARLAEPQLTPVAHAQVRRLLATERLQSLADIANWADELRGMDPSLGRRSAKWHYVNFDGGDCHFVPARDCRNGDCVVDALGAQVAILADRNRSDAERLQALKFVVHFTGDIHQPLHAGLGSDRGGNTFQVNYRGKGSNLHAFWDSTLLASRGLGETTYLWRLRASQAATPASAEPYTTDSPAEWAEQSCVLVHQPGFYPSSARIGDDYVARHRPTAERQLKLAGSRLAALLNATLD